MISVLEPRPHKNLALPESSSVPIHAPSNLNTLPKPRSHPLPTPAPSPSPSQSSYSASASSSSTFSSPSTNMLALGGLPSTLAPFSRSFSPFTPTFSPSQSRLSALRQCMPATPEDPFTHLPSIESEQLDAFRGSKSRVVRVSVILHASPLNPLFRYRKMRRY
ncbi:uncharacterized protein FOMMEDRAFT_154053 [Fomitiporia mediterranea MF3/22]|uniref:uncharacterized protein n=1 Tax=Fomitiporia mediterranea (strain MF3/22) TaxID=694068 RepID=UPI000440932A|nr:uncharacterized protein FOMMEDRAFT_154053 [Fomitiporia mediterranea MF3/22]EJD04903.1 hypothetical protein FOMMEDRAFT_154053 [Fomitiporia mediterranea MF3/22]